MRESIGMPVSMSLSVSLISPPKATVSPDCMATVLLILRCRMVGESIPELKVATASLTSCSISRITRPPALTLGVTLRMTPVSTCWKVLVTPPVSATTSPVLNGTVSPTWIVAV